MPSDPKTVEVSSRWERCKTVLPFAPGVSFLENLNGSELGPSTYLLLLVLRETVGLQAGSLGEVMLEPGVYGYAGSAKRAAAARLGRHFRRCKPQRWHVDYLTAHPDTEVRAAIVWPSSLLTECHVVGRLLSRRTSIVPVAGFGASDCTQGCPAHLIRLASDASTAEILEDLLRRLPPPARIVLGVSHQAV